jgi:hypothetical protein
VADDPTLGEVARRLEAVRLDLKDDVRELAARIDGRVSMERYQPDSAARDRELIALVERIKALEEAAREKEKLHAMDRRLIFSALIVPVFMVLLQVYLATRGAA